MKKQHYFTEKPDIKVEYQYFDFVFGGNQFRFATNSGVFSKDSVDFGSKLLLDTLDKIAVRGKILEVGCGYGPISLCLAKGKKDIFIDMVDINELAVKLSCDNKKANAVDNVNVFKSNVFENVGSKYDLIFSNPPIRAGKIVTYRIYEESLEHLNKGGLFLIVIQKKQGAETVKKKLFDLYGNVETLNRDKGYFVFCSKKS